MNGIRKILLRSLGEKKYLWLLAFSFQRLYKTGRLGSDYQDLYFLKKMIATGDYCLDIGAHLGYYTLELSRLVKAEGRVYAIEPVSKFHHTLQKLLQKKNVHNVTLYQLALGGRTAYVEMGIPKLNNMKKFAYARVMETSPHLSYAETERVKNEQGDELFEELPRLDFIKCDVEGLEVPVFSSMMRTLGRHTPVLLCELAEKKERIKLYEMLSPLGYRAYSLENKMLLPLDVYSEKTPISHNHYFIPATRKEKLKQLIAD
jgi:FkbM family methyltransferase